jgi:uncharacterized membrane protein YgdD (TMEM256/DUF423 family)
LDRVYAIAGAISGFLSVAAGAFGAHALKRTLSPESIAIFETGARYQMYHALALLATAWMASQWPGTMPLWAGRCFIAGTVLFSGSLYLLALTSVTWLGAITPIGGLAFLAGWICLALAARGT